MTSALSDLEQALLGLDRVRAAEIVEQATTNGSPLEVIEQLVRPVLERIGEQWEAGNCALSQVYMSGRICEELLNRLLGNPTQAGLALTSPGRRTPRLAIAVLDDYHMLGKQIVRTVVRASGYPIEDLGRVDVEALVEKVAAQDIEVLLVSTLMLPAALRVAELTKRLAALSPGTRVVVGGAPYRADDQLWRDVGADAMGLHAGEVIGIILRLTGDNA